MHDAHVNALGDLKRVMSDNTLADELKTQFIQANGVEVMFKCIHEGPVLASVTNGATACTTIAVRAYKSEGDDMILESFDGSTMRLHSTTLPEMSKDRSVFATSEELKFIREAILGIAGQYYDSPNGWNLVCDNRGAVICFDGIEFVVDKIEDKGRYTHFFSTKSLYNMLLMSKSNKCPF